MSLDNKISALANYLTPITTDFLAVVDISTGETKKIDLSLIQKPISDIDYGGFDINNVGFIESNGANPASAGFIRMDSVDKILWQESGDTFDLGLQLDTLDNLEYFKPSVQPIFTIRNSGTETIGDRMELRFKSGTSDHGVIRVEPVTTGGSRDSKIQFFPYVGGIVSDYLTLNGSTEQVVIGANMNMQNNDIIIGTGELQFLTAGTFIREFQNDMIFNVSISDDFEWRIDGAVEMELDSNGMTMNGNFDLPTNAQIRWAVDIDRSIGNNTIGMSYQVPEDDIHDFLVENIRKLMIDVDGITIGGNDVREIRNVIHDISASGTDVDFDEDQVQTISISANTTFTGTNYVAGKSKTIYITTDGTLRTLAFPSGWIFMGAKPADQDASKVGVLTLDSTTGAEAGVRAAYAVEE